MLRPDPKGLKKGKLPGKLRKRLKDEALTWESALAKEKPEKTAGLIARAERFGAKRPTRKPVSLRLDPLDLSLVQRLARRKGIPSTQLMSMWLHERVIQEQGKAG